jgi:hypothetical protein
VQLVSTRLHPHRRVLHVLLALLISTRMHPRHAHHAMWARMLVAVVPSVHHALQALLTWMPRRLRRALCALLAHSLRPALPRVTLALLELQTRTVTPPRRVRHALLGTMQRSQPYHARHALPVKQT